MLLTHRSAIDHLPYKPLIRGAVMKRRAEVIELIMVFSQGFLGFVLGCFWCLRRFTGNTSPAQYHLHRVLAQFIRLLHDQRIDRGLMSPIKGDGIGVVGKSRISAIHTVQVDICKPVLPA